MKRYGYLIALLLCCSPLFAAKILVIDSYHASYPWTQECRFGLKKNLDPTHQLEIFSLDTKRLPLEKHPVRIEEAWDYFQKTNPDLVITMDDNALKYLGERITSTGTPVVFMGVNANPRKYFTGEGLPGNLYGVLERPVLKRSLMMIAGVMEYKPGKVLLMMDEGPTSQAILETGLDGKRSFTGGRARLESFLTSDFETWKAKINKLKFERYDALIIANFAILKDKEGQVVPMLETSRWSGEHSPVPVFSFWRYSVGKGMSIGGLIISGYYQGEGAAKKANAILAGEKITPISIPKRGEYLYSKSELERWGFKLQEPIKSAAQMIE